jgi:hypothetical protein
MLHEDFEKNRVEYVMLLEQQLKHARAELEVAKSTAAMWEPKASAEMHLNEATVKVTLSYGGKVASINLADSEVAAASESDVVLFATDKLIEAVVSEKIRELLRPHISTVKKNVGVRHASGKW